MHYCLFCLQVHKNWRKEEMKLQKNGQRIIKGSDMEGLLKQLFRRSHADDAVKKKPFNWNSNPNHFVSIFCRQIKERTFHASFQRNELIESSSIKWPVSFIFTSLKRPEKITRTHWGKESLKLCWKEMKKSLDWIKQINKLLRQKS